MHSLEVLPFINGPKKVKILDIRTKEAFLKGHLPGAIHLPFPIQLKEIRKQFGSGIPLRDLKHFIEDYEEWSIKTKAVLSQDTPTYIYCQSGGLRSYYFFKLWEKYKRQIYFLGKGYEGYCYFQNQFFSELQFRRLYVLAGGTGSGKTATLDTLQKRGRQVINLSLLARHQGSVFGGINHDDSQPTSIQFQHNLFELCRNLNTELPIFVEAEGPFIGRICLPKLFYEILEKGNIIFLKIPLSARAEYLVKVYGGIKTAKILDSLKKIRARLSLENYTIAMNCIRSKKKKEFAKLMITYYDQGIQYRRYLTKTGISFNFLEVDIISITDSIEKYLSVTESESEFN